MNVSLKKWVDKTQKISVSGKKRGKNKTASNVKNVQISNRSFEKRKVTDWKKCQHFLLFLRFRFFVENNFCRKQKAYRNS